MDSFFPSFRCLSVTYLMISLNLLNFQMLEIGTCMELMKKSEKPTKEIDSEFTDISFEELLAQEKKDSFW